MSYYRVQLEEWLRKIDVQANKVLDIGGSANPVEKRVKSWNVKEYHLLDNSLELTYHKTWEHPHFPFDIQQADLINVMTEKYHHRYELIFCLEVFEYIINPLQAIHNIWSLLEDGGSAYITFPFVYPLHQPVTNDYLRYTKSAVQRLTKIFDRVDITERIDQSGLLTSFYATDGMRMAKGEKHNTTGFLVTCTK